MKKQKHVLTINIYGLHLPMELSRTSELTISVEALAQALKMEEAQINNVLKEIDYQSVERQIPIHETILILAMAPNSVFQAITPSRQLEQYRMRMKNFLSPPLISAEFLSKEAKNETPTNNVRAQAVYRAALQLANEARHKLQESK